MFYREVATAFYSVWWSVVASFLETLGIETLCVGRTHDVGCVLVDRSLVEYTLVDTLLLS